MAYKAMYKNEIARAAGVSRAVFRVWLKADKQALEAMGITPKQQLLPPVAVRTFTVSYRDDKASMNQGREITKARTMKFICLREKGRGVKPLYVSITPEEMEIEEDFALLVSDYCPEKSDAMMIYRIINDYGFTKAIDLFALAGEGALKSDEYYWLNGYSLDRYRHRLYWEAIRLSDGDVVFWEITYYDPHKHALLKIDWFDE